jgi:hypothetical protein
LLSGGRPVHLNIQSNTCTIILQLRGRREAGVEIGIVKEVEETRIKCRKYKHFVRTDDLDDVRTKHLQRKRAFKRKKIQWKTKDKIE